MTVSSLVAFASRSTVRQQVLRTLARTPSTAETLVTDLSVSRSGVYKALDELEDQALVTDDRDVWTVTSLGRLVVDEIERHDALDELASDREYWLSHDVSVLPRRLRTGLVALRDLEVLRNRPNDPRYLERWGVELLRDADHLTAGSTILHDEYANAMDQQVKFGSQTRLVTDRSLVDDNPQRYQRLSQRRPDGVDERVCDLPCSFTLTDDVFTLSLPLMDGRYDRETELVAESPEALAFGERFVNYYWERATPLNRYIRDRLEQQNRSAQSNE